MNIVSSMDTLTMLVVARETRSTYETSIFGVKYRFSVEHGLKIENDTSWKDSEDTSVYLFMQMEDWKVVEHIEQITKEEVEHLLGKTIGEIVENNKKLNPMNKRPKLAGKFSIRNVILYGEDIQDNPIVEIGYCESGGDWQYWDKVEENWKYLEDHEAEFLGWQELYEEVCK
jgi:hypothetical protein